MWQLVSISQVEISRFQGIKGVLHKEHWTFVSVGITYGSTLDKDSYAEQMLSSLAESAHFTSLGLSKNKCHLCEIKRC